MLVDLHRDRFEELYSVTPDRPVTFARPCEKWVVWPTEGETRDPREEELAEVGIRVASYEERDGGFASRIGDAQ